MTKQNDIHHGGGFSRIHTVQLWHKRQRARHRSCGQDLGIASVTIIFPVRKGDVLNTFVTRREHQPDNRITCCIMSNKSQCGG